MSATNLITIQKSSDDSTHAAHLPHRLKCTPNSQAEHPTPVKLTPVPANLPRDILQHLAEVCLELCDPGSCGVGTIKNGVGQHVFRWHALTGTLAPHGFGTTSREFSPCCIVIECNATQLMRVPESWFHKLTSATQLLEVLLVARSVMGERVRTIWIVAHSKNRQFDAEDARLIEGWAPVTSKAGRLSAAAVASQIEDRRKNEFLAALAKEFSRTPYMSAARSAMTDWGHPLHSMKCKIDEVRERSRILLGLEPKLRRPAQEALAIVLAPHHRARSRPRTLPVASIPLPRRPREDGRSKTMRNVPRARPTSIADAISMVQRMGRGDQRALADLYRCTVSSVYALARTILKSDEDAEEVVCDTYAQAWRQSERFDSERGSPRGWLLAMCRGRAIDRLRHNRSRGTTKTVSMHSVCEPIHDAPSPEELLSLLHDGSRVQEALTALSPQRLKLVRLAFFEGLSFPELAAHTGLPLGTVKSHIRRALVELRRELKASDHLRV